MPSLDNIFGIHAAALKLREQRMAILGSNIANASTPGYKARDIEFPQALRLVESGQSVDAAMRYRVPMQPSMDGNSVELFVACPELTALPQRISLSGLSGNALGLNDRRTYCAYPHNPPRGR